MPLTVAWSGIVTSGITSPSFRVGAVFPTVGAYFSR
jgi:hypothetical protein